MKYKQFKIWNAITASDQKTEVRNKIYSERLPFPSSIFTSPFPPPSVKELKLLQAKEKGENGRAVFFGPINFGVGGTPTENLLVVSYKKEENYWRFSSCEYQNLSALPEVRTELKNNDFNYLRKSEFLPTPSTYSNKLRLTKPVPVIGKVYAFCPNHKITIKVNQSSNHTFQHEKQAELIMGGLKKGLNTITYTLVPLKERQGDEIVCLRVYAISQKKGINPIKVYEKVWLETTAKGEKMENIFSLTSSTIGKMR